MLHIVSLQFQCPLEILKGQPADVTRIEVFVCLRFPHIMNLIPHTLAHRARICIFLL